MRMKAIVRTKYGSQDVLYLKEVERPDPKGCEVLVKVYAASVNVDDLEHLRGTPVVRLTGLLKPKHRILGSDIAGRVEAVGKNVKHLERGDAVFGDLTDFGFGAFAEYVSVPETALVLKPACMTFEEASTVTSRAAIAAKYLRAKRKIQPEQKVLINGAGGGVGTFAVQLAKFYGAEVTAVDSAEKLDMLRSIGANHVVDYTKEDFTENRQSYDLIIDVAAHHSIFDYKRALCANGIYLLVGGSRTAIFQTLFLGPLISITGSKKMGIPMEPNKKEDLVFVKELIESGMVVPVIDRCYPFSEVAEAMRYLEQGKHRGKIVITM